MPDFVWVRSNDWAAGGFYVVFIWHRNWLRRLISVIRASYGLRSKPIAMLLHTFGYAVQLLSYIITTLTILFIQRGLESQGLIYKDTYTGWYSVSDECFYTDAQISLTTSPSGEGLSVSSETGSIVTHSSEETYKFRLSTFRSRLLDHFLAHPEAIQPKPYYDHIVQQLSESELEDLSVSRPRSRLEWGVRVPTDEDQTIYVWIDALTVYLTGAGYPWKDGITAGGWPADMQIIGKDIIKSVLFFITCRLTIEPILILGSMRFISPLCLWRCQSLFPRHCSRTRIGQPTARRCRNL